MKRKNKAIIWIVIFILVIFASLAVSTYAFLKYRLHYHGDFEVEVNSKGVDILEFNGGKEATLIATADNFAPKFGRDLTASTDIEVKLDTTNRSATFCYEVYVHLPKEKIFEYTQEGRPELLLNVYTAGYDRKYRKVISNMDVTTKTGDIKVPVTINGSEYLNIISTTKRRVAYQYWQASLTLVYFSDVDQEINDNKTYIVSLETKRVDC